jgi:hypothetical protein
METILEQLTHEFKRPPSRRRKKVIKQITPKLISDIESEIIKIDFYLTCKVIQAGKSGIKYQPSDNDEDQGKRERLKYLRELRLKLLA